MVYKPVSMKLPELTIVIPAYNEEKRLPDALERIHDYMDGRGENCEIIVVDDGSSDGTAGLAEAARKGIPALKVLVNETNRGKGYSVRKGFLAGTGDLVLISDADLSAPIEEYEHLKRVLEENEADGVIGSRALPGAVIEIHQSFVRRTMGMTFNLLVRMITGLPYRDTQCGFKLFRRAAFETVFEKLNTEGFAFDVEVLLRARKKGLKVVEEPVRWENSPDSSVHIIKDSLGMLIELTAIRLKLLGKN